MTAEYYVLDHRQIVGNCCVWWCPDGKGYTCDVRKAGLYRKGDRTWRPSDVLVHRSLVDRVAAMHVDEQALWDWMTLPFRDGERPQLRDHDLTVDSEDQSPAFYDRVSASQDKAAEDYIRQRPGPWVEDQR